MNPVNDSHPHVIEVSSSYIDYIKWCLEGGPILGDFLLEEIDFSNGSLMAFLPNDRWDDVLLDPRMGLPTINRQEMPAVGQSYIALYRLAQFLHKHMAEINCAGIVVDYLSIPSDPIVERWGGRDHLGSLVVLDFDKEVYYYFCQANSVEYVQ